MLEILLLVVILIKKITQKLIFHVDQKQMKSLEFKQKRKKKKKKKKKKMKEKNLNIFKIEKKSP